MCKSSLLFISFFIAHYILVVSLLNSFEKEKLHISQHRLALTAKNDSFFRYPKFKTSYPVAILRKESLASAQKMTQIAHIEYQSTSICQQNFIVHEKETSNQLGKAYLEKNNSITL